MNAMRNLIVKADQSVRGQTMTEYALILAAVAVVVFAGYQILGTDINGLLSSIDNLL
jgi:Flp pilus assembly pilin Flp